MAYQTFTLHLLRDYVRELTGVYSVDVISDDTISQWINEAYSDLSRQQEWTWSNNTSPAASLIDSTAPAFGAQYHPLLAYKVAAKVLDTQADDTQRSVKYLEEYKSIVDSLVQDDLQIAITGNVVNYSNFNDYSLLVKFVRQLINVYDGTVSNAYIENKLVDEYKQLAHAYTWNWTYNGSLQWIAVYARILGYGVATRLSIELGMPEILSKALQSEYDAVLTEMKRTDLYVSYSLGNSPSYENIAKKIRTVTSEYSKDISNDLLYTWIDEELAILTSERNWSYLYTGSFFVYGGPTFSSGTINSGNPETGAWEKTIDIWNTNVPYNEELGTPPTPGEITNIQLAQEVNNTNDIEANSAKYYWSQTADGKVISLLPVPDIMTWWYVRGKWLTHYQPSEESNLVKDRLIMFDTKFDATIVYKVAIKVALLSQNVPNAKQLIQVYQDSYDRMHEAMVKHYQNSISESIIQMGSKGFDERKYIPYFKVN